MDAGRDEHTPALVQEVLNGLNIRPAGVYVDCTFGRGGHAEAILKRLGEEGHLLAIDKDPEAVAAAQDQFASDGRFAIEQGSYTMLLSLVQKHGHIGNVDGVLFDLGVSSPQLADAGRGFSFNLDGPLDMRMNRHTGITAAQWLNAATQHEIAEVLHDYGEERYAERVARAIIDARKTSPITRTRQLANIVVAASPTRERNKHPATRTFQALRILINRELDDLNEALSQVVRILAPGGRLLVISFHSLEDRLVKRFIRDQARGDAYPQDIPITQTALRPTLRAVGRVIRATEEEKSRNPRSRSARLRIAEKIAA